MNLATGLAVYLVIWWIVLFAVLPIGVERARNPGKGHDPGAPERPDLLRKAIITTLVAAVVWLAFFVAYEMDILSFRRLADET